MNFANIKLTKQEYAQFMAAVNTNYFVRYAHKNHDAIIIDNTIYYFHIIDFNEYKILTREELK